VTSRFSLRDEASTGGAYSGEGVVVLVAAGELDYAAWPQFRRCVLGLIDSGARGIVLELSLLTFIDSAAIGVLVSAANRLQGAGEGRLVVACAPENARILRIFDIAGVARLIPLHHSREDAIAALELSDPDLLPALPRRQSTPLGDTEKQAPGTASGPGAVRRYVEDAAAGGDVDPVGDGAGSPSEVDELA
jgi:anti-sigma B factor antagonist